jgi:ribosomal protein S14
MGTKRSDWLDGCWRCGAEQIEPGADGTVLCASCREEALGRGSGVESGLGALRRLYWEAHPLERCWRCMVRPVDVSDEVGLCRPCLREEFGVGVAG